MTVAKSIIMDELAETLEAAQPVAFTSDAPTEWRPKPNRAQRRKIEREMRVFRRKQGKAR
jgi:hypothetical protein